MAEPGARKGKPLPARHKLSPAELARAVAHRLATEDTARRRRFLRHSVLVGRLVFGLMVLLVSLGLILSFLVGFDRLTASESRVSPMAGTGGDEVVEVPAEVSGVSLVNTTTLPPPLSIPFPSTSAMPWLPRFPTATTLGGEGAPTTPSTSPSQPTLTTAAPSTTPTTTPPPATTPTPVTTTTAATSTTAPTTTSTVAPTTTTTVAATSTTICCARAGGQGCLPPPQCP